MAWVELLVELGELVGLVDTIVVTGEDAIENVVDAYDRVRQRMNTLIPHQGYAPLKNFSLAYSHTFVPVRTVNDIMKLVNTYDITIGCERVIMINYVESLWNFRLPLGRFPEDELYIPLTYGIFNELILELRQCLTIPRNASNKIILKERDKFVEIMNQIFKNVNDRLNQVDRDDFEVKFGLQWS